MWVSIFLPYSSKQHHMKAQRFYLGNTLTTSFGLNKALDE